MNAGVVDQEVQLLAESRGMDGVRTGGPPNSPPNSRVLRS